MLQLQRQLIRWNHGKLTLTSVLQQLYLGSCEWVLYAYSIVLDVDLFAIEFEADEEIIPITYQEAIALLDASAWKCAMEDEIQSLNEKIQRL